MVAFQVRAAIALGQARTQRAPYVLHTVREPVAAQNPDDGLIAVSAAKEFAVIECAGLVQNRGLVGADGRYDTWSVTRVAQQLGVLRSEERRVGEEGRSRW